MLLVLCFLVSASQAFIVPSPSSRPAIRRTTNEASAPLGIALTGKRFDALHMQIAAAEEKPFWEAWRVHDYFNLAVLPVIVALTATALFNQPWNYPLAIVMFAYVAIDGLWIALQPHIVASPVSLLWHHVATLLIIAHALTWAPHTKYVSWMTTVEVNTFFLILKRHVAHPLFEFFFKATWLAIRIITFPCVAVYFTFFIGGTWGGGLLNLLRRVVVCSCVSGLAILQLQWTWKAMIAPMLKKRKGEPEADAAKGKKKGFL